MSKPSKLQIRLMKQRREVQERLGAQAKGASLKGVRGGNCNVTACQRPGAWFFNYGTNAYYCRHCATDIHHFNRRSGDDFVLFPNFDEDMKAHDAWLAERITRNVIRS